MGRELFRRFDAFRSVLHRCEDVLRELRPGVSLLDAMFGAAADIDDTTWAQPALYAFEVALGSLWR